MLDDEFLSIMLYDDFLPAILVAFIVALELQKVNRKMI